ncbi:MAG: hypothetical protein Q3983_06705 [Capnocytophaga sp.]|nr:hypothetical protein [Capnocytophaga sp.]
MKINIKYSIVFLICFSFFSCNFLKNKEKNTDAIARIDDDYLYKTDIEKILPKDYSLEDSLTIATTFVNNWALKKLLMQRAEENLPEEKKEEFKELVAEYERDLYTQSYLEMLVAEQIDTSIYQVEKKLFYDENKNIFKLNESLLKFRYIQLNDKEVKNKKIIEYFKKFSPEDKQELENNSTHFVSAFFNDTIWVKTADVYEKLPFLKGKLDKKITNQFIEQKDSTGIYLVKVIDFLDVNEFAPLEYVTPTLNQIILNRRRNNYINDLEKDIINNAIKKKQFEIYE